MLGGQPIVDRDHEALGVVTQATTEGIVTVHRADHPASPMEEDQHRPGFLQAVGGIEHVDRNDGHVEANRHVAPGALHDPALHATDPVRREPDREDEVAGLGRRQGLDGGNPRLGQSLQKGGRLRIQWHQSGDELEGSENVRPTLPGVAS